MPKNNKINKYLSEHGTVGNKRHRIVHAPKQQSQKETNNDYNSKQPLKQSVGETDKGFLERQRTQTQNSEKPQKNGLVQRGKNYANEQTNKVKDYGTQKGKEAIESGKNYAKEKGKDFLNKNPKTAEGINKAQEAKQNFENRMNMFRDNAELSARKPPIKQTPGESDMDFRRRQQEENEPPGNRPRMSLGGAAKQHAKDYGTRQAGKATQGVKNYANRKLADNPKLKASLEKTKEKTDAFKKRRSEDIKKLAEKKKALTNKFNKLKASANKLKEKLNVKKRLEDKLKRRVAQFALRFLIPVIGGILVILAKLLVICLIIVIIIIAIDYACKYNALTDAACSAVSGISSWF